MAKISLKEAIQATSIFENANPSSLALLASGGMLTIYKKGQHIFRDREEVGMIYIVIHGAVTLYKIDSLGEKKVIFVYGKGALLNEVLFGDLRASVSCEIQENALVLCFPQKLFLQAMEQDFELTKAVMGELTIKIRRLYRQLKNTSNALRVDKRIAAKLWKLAKDYGKPEEDGVMIDLEISITYLSDMIAAKRETVSRQIKILTEKGLVIVKRNRFMIPDMEALSNYFKGISE